MDFKDKDCFLMLPIFERERERERGRVQVGEG